MDPYAPFLIAALVLVALVAFEVAGAFFGFSSAFGEGAHEADSGPGPLDWINRGRVPFSVLLILFLGLFSATGLLVQSAAAAVAGPMPALGASAISAGVALLTTGEASRLVARILPREESYAAHADDLIGAVGVVTVGPLGGDSVGKIRVADSHGNMHFPLARPLEAGAVIPVGADVVLHSRSGQVFFVIRKDTSADTSGGIALAAPPSDA